jgi:hypothetical protein
MKYSPFRDRKFLTLFGDAILATLTVVVAHVVPLDLQKDVIALGGTWVALGITVALGFAVEDAAIARNEGAAALPHFKEK